MCLSYIYKIKNKNSGEFYIGKRYTNRYSNFSDDPYMGSGKWIRDEKHNNVNFIHEYEKVLVEYCSIDDLNDREMYHIKKNISHSLNRNKTLGGDGFSVGELNPKFKTEICVWKNILTDEIFEGNINAFYTKFGLSISHTLAVFNGEISYVKGWCCISVDGFERNDNIEIRNHGRVYEWLNCNGEKFSGTQNEFRQYSGIDRATITKLTKNKVESKGWVCYNVFNSIVEIKSVLDRSNHKTYSWVNKDTGVTFYGNAYDLSKEYDLNVRRIQDVVKNRRKSYKKWFIKCDG